MALWTPANIATALWMDASDSATITLNGSTISQWADKSGNGKHASQATASAQPALITSGLGGLNVAEFDGIDDYLSLAAGIVITTNMTVATVFGRATAGIYSQPMGGSVANSPPYPVQWWTDNVAYAALGSGHTTHGSASNSIGSFITVTTRTASTQIVRRNGVKLGTDQTAPSVGSNPLSYIGRRSPQYHKGMIAEIVVCASTDDVERLEGYLAWKWGMQASLPVGHPYVAAAPEAVLATAVTAGLVGTYDDAVSLEAGLIGQYSLVLEQGMVGRYGNAQLVLAGLIGRYADAAQVQSCLCGRYGDMVPVLAVLEGRYHLMHAVVAGLVGQYAICGTEVLAGLAGRYDLKERNEILAALEGYYSLLPSATIQQIACPVRIGGVAVRWSSVSWTISEDSYLIEATITLRVVAEYNSIAKMDTVEIDWAGTTYHLFVATKLRSRSISGDAGAADYGAEYTIIARSLTAGLDAPYAMPITRSWPATTLASTIAADLIAPLSDILTLDFRLEDWLQPGGTFFVTDESPLEGLRKLAAIVGGILQTSPGNALILRPADPTPPASWATTAPAWTIEDSGLFSDAESEAESNRYNVITVTNQGESNSSTRFEVEDISEYRKRVRGYRVPWQDFALGTSGGSWVTIEDGGVVEEQAVDELVEFIDGASSALKPIYSQVAAVWLQASLGTITAAEDGSLTAAVVGNSLAKITYTTRCHVWIGSSDRSEEVQFYEVEA